MQQVHGSQKVENFLSEIAQHLKMRFSDVFFSYFIFFELIYNWKFFYTLIIGDEKKAGEIIKLASTHLVHPDFLNQIYVLLGEPTAFTRSLLSSIFMTLAYPFIQFAILYLRKRIFYFTNKELESDYPTRKDYDKIKVEIKESLEKVRQIKDSRILDISNIGQMLIKENVLPGKEKIHYAVVIGSEKNNFNIDELVKISKDNSLIIEKIDPGAYIGDDIYLITQKIHKDIFLVAKVSSQIPVSRTMIERGREFFVMTNLGTPHYLDHEDFEKVRIDSNRSILFWARIDKNLKFADVERA